MKFKRLILSVTTMVTLFAFMSTNVFADINMGSGDGTGFGTGSSNNFWGVKVDGGSTLYETEGLRVTVYDSSSDSKTAKTLDITGSTGISAINNIVHFSNGSNLISKTEWLSYVGTTYNAIDTSSINKFNGAVLGKLVSEDYDCKYVPELASLDIISPNNKANLDKIKSALSAENFLRNLCDLIGGLSYEDFEKGKYKIAFEPVAYFCYGGSNMAMTATECALYNKFLRNNHLKDGHADDWFNANGPVMTVGTLTHSNLPRSAFLETKDLGIQPYKAASSDYYFSGNSNYNSDNCIIRCMGIGVLSALGKEEDKPDAPLIGSSATAEYHTDTDVYTAFYFRNDSGADIFGGGGFSIYNSDGETPRSSFGPISEQVIVSYDDDGDPRYAYLTDETGDRHIDPDSSVDVFVNNPEYLETDKPYGVPPYKKLGTFKDGDFINGGAGEFSYTIRSAGNVIKSGTVSFTCPNGEEAMGWFDWHTPKTAQNVTITIKSSGSGIYLLDSNGNPCTYLSINAKVDKITEHTPPDPTATDKRPSWQNNYSESSVMSGVSQYAPVNGSDTLTWYVWAFDWYQMSWDSTSDKPSKFSYVAEAYQGDPDDDYENVPTEKAEYWKSYYGVDNRYYANEQTFNSGRLGGQKYQSAVILSGGARKIEYTVSLSADMEISPSERCPTASYSNSSGMYTMKSGYGIQIKVRAHLSGDTSLCTGSQSANVLFPEFNYNTQSTAVYNRLLEKNGTEYAFKKNEYSTYNDRVHFTPIWFPDDSYYTAYAEVFDVWCPAGQLSVRLTDKMLIKGNVFDDWHVAPEKP